jgi:hypothetical protein
MCLTNLMNEKQLKKFKRTLPFQFSVWKVMRRKGIGEFALDRYAKKVNSNEVELIEPGIYYARNCPAQRLPITYKPGFHVFLNGEDAKVYARDFGVIQEFSAKRSWIKQAGQSDNKQYKQPSWIKQAGQQPCLVLSRIEVRKE